MKTLNERLQKIAAAINLTDIALAWARSRYSYFHKRAVRFHKRAVKVQKRADAYRAQHHLARAADLDRKAARLRNRAHRCHDKSQWWIARVKRLVQKKKGLLATQAELRAALAAWKKKHSVSISGNTVTGGTAQQRLHAAMLASAAACASGKRPNFYSQGGSWDVEHCITGERYGERSDCSSWFTSLYKACGLSDPNDNSFRGGYTGTLAAGGKTITRTAARSIAGAAVLFGDAPFHHVEAALGDGSERTVGHGSAPVDLGIFDLLPGPKTFKSYP
jgi:hypothetical protein